MFTLSRIWKPAFVAPLWAAVLLTVMLVFGASTAQAYGETYTWSNTEKASVSATGGNFTNNTITFSKSDTNPKTFTTTASYLCGTGTKTSTLTLTVDDPATNPARGVISGADGSCADTFTVAIINTPNVDPVMGTPTDGAKPECNQGSFTWLFCPVIDNITNTISSLAKDVLVPLLRVNQITPESTPQLFDAWKHMRDLADIFFILIFLVVIFGTLLQQDWAMFDAYTLRKLWPRFILAVVLVQFSFLFSGFIVDIGNVTGAGIEKLLVDVARPSSGPATVANLLQNLVTGAVGVAAGAGAIAVLASWTAALPILLSVLLSLLVVFLTLGARFLLIAVLVVISPFAFASLVLPNTNKYFGNWLEFLFRLVMMYPLVIGVIILASMVNQILPFSGDTADGGAANVAAGIIKPLIVVAAFMIIPASFKLAGAAMNRAHGLLKGTADRGKGLLKGSDMWQRGIDERQDRKNEYMKRVLNSKGITKLGSKNALGRGAASMAAGAASLALLKAPANSEALERSESARLSARKKQAEGLNEGWNPNNIADSLLAYRGATAKIRDEARKRALKNSPNLLKIAGTPTGQRALLQMANDREMLPRDLINASLKSDQKDSWRVSTGNLRGNYAADMQAIQSKRNFLPSAIIRVTEAKEMEFKDSAGNVLAKEWREVGDINKTDVAKAVSKLGGKISDPKNFSLDNWAIMSQSAPKTVNESQETRIGRDFAEAFFVGANPQQITKIFDISDPRFSDSNPEVRVQALRAFHNNSHFLKQTINGEANDKYKPEFNAAYDIATASLSNDHRVVEQLARSMNIDQAMWDGYSVGAKAQIVRDWVKGTDYDPSRAYEAEAAQYANAQNAAKVQAQVEARTRRSRVQSRAQSIAQGNINQETQHLRDAGYRPDSLPGDSPGPTPPTP